MAKHGTHKHSLSIVNVTEGRGYEQSTSKIWSCNTDGDSFIIEPRVQYKISQV